MQRKPVLKQRLLALNRRVMTFATARRALIMLIILLFGAGLFLVRQWIQSINANRADEAARLTADVTADWEPMLTPTPPVSPTNTPATNREEGFEYGALLTDEPILSFTDALSKNADVVGALEAGSDIQAFVVERDNQYYLDHSISLEQNAGGAVFMDDICSIVGPSQNMIVYGHNMHNGTMFGKLKSFKQKSYLNVFPLIRFCTLKEDAYYAVFSVLEFSTNPDDQYYFRVRQADFETEASFATYLYRAKQLSKITIPVDINPSDMILTLITCVNTGRKDMRFAVMARKLRNGEDSTDFFNLFQEDIRDLAYVEGMPLIKGPDVVTVQKALAEKGYYQGSFDGDYGPTTAYAVQAFQTANHLTADGVVGEQTRIILLGDDD